MLLPFLGPLVLAMQLAGTASAEGTWRRLENLVDDCAFTLGKTKYNLCPVFNGNEDGWTVEFRRKTPPTVTKTSYKINLKGPLEELDNVPKHEQCPPGTWICQTITNRRPLHEEEDPRVLQVVPVAGAMSLSDTPDYKPGVSMSAHVEPARGNPKENILHVHLHGGYYVSSQQSADLQFRCDGSVDEPSVPTYLYNWNGTHYFTWRTKHACGSQQATPVPSKPDTPPPDEDTKKPPVNTDPSSPDGKSGQELTDEPPFSRHTVRTTMIALLSSCTALLMLGYLAWHPPVRVRQYVRGLVKAHPRLGRFRVGERVLVRWAYEDMELDEDFGYAESEEDTMVNFSADDEVVGEGIPLKPSPRHGMKWMNYGTA